MISILLFQQAPAATSDHTIVIFFAEVAMMLIVGRFIGEVMHRLGQPEVLGQLLAGIILGPTVFGRLLPGAHNFIFPDAVELKKMIDAISQLGILMLLLLAGMETDFKIVRRQKRTAIFSSLSGIILPFVCGLALGELLPDSLLPAPGRRLITALFLATALSISSVKIVAMVIMEVDFMRRNIGQLILASAIIDDTVGWIIVAVISGVAAAGTVDIKAVGFIVAGTLIFLALSFTFGRTLITYVIRWSNDTLQIDFAVLSIILVLMCLLSIVTDLIGVHTVLGAFVTGILVGQSPILTEHIRDQLRGLVLGFFAPIFFAVAGLSVDLTILKSFSRLELAVALILIASVGKLGGCLVGGKLGGLTTREAVALAVGMNARGTTEVIIATIGLSIGVLSKDFYTLIVLMAVATTMVMPPMLRAALRRIPLREKEKERLAREDAEAKDFVPRVERLLIAADESNCGELAALLGGLFVGARKILATVLEIAPGRAETAELMLNAKLADRVKFAIAAVAELSHDKKKEEKSDDDEKPEPPAQLNIRASTASPGEALLHEMENGYDMIFVGLKDGLAPAPKDTGQLTSSIEEVIKDFKGAVAIAIIPAGIDFSLDDDRLNILTPATGTDYSRRAVEVGIALAKGGRGKVTALNVSPAQGLHNRSNHEHLKPGRQILKDIKEMGQRESVTVKTIAKVQRNSEAAIIKQAKSGKHNLLVVGANIRPGEGLFFGHSINMILERAPCAVLVVSS
jgi:Kef-type K+ transport system membrane component KefB/nucleotide-binding universal stress UspA family protein